jgi:hypothetical protein
MSLLRAAVFAFALLTPAGMLFSVEKEDLSFADLEAPEHDYWNRPLNDPFTKIKDDLEKGRMNLDESSEKAFLESLLKALKIPVSSQMLVYSTTSLQLSLISPRTPRALYFNEEIYLGYVQGGRIEIVSIDPDLGGIFYIFDIPQSGKRPVAERSRRCMNCHSDEDTHEIPGLVIKSVVPGPTGGSLESYRRAQTGHEIPLSDRFGGWHVTGAEGIGKHWGNLTGRFTPEGIVTTPLPPGERFDWSVFPVATSDLLAQLLHEHQVGFVNRVVQAQYRLRTALKRGSGRLSEEDRSEVSRQVEELTRYLLFAQEAALPGQELQSDGRFKEEFLADRRLSSKGDSLKDLDLTTRIFRNRCSYMIYSPVFQNLPAGFKKRIYDRMGEALSASRNDPEFAYLRADEKARVRTILKETLPDLPADW